MARMELISISQAARMLGYKSKRTILRLGHQGLLHPRLVRGRWMVTRTEVRCAKVLTTGRAAKLAGCSKKTVYRRLAAGLLTPVRPAKPADWISERALPRLSLEDVANLRDSIQRRRSARRAITKRPRRGDPPTRSPGDRPRLARDARGRLWLHAHGRWWALAAATSVSGATS